MMFSLSWAPLIQATYGVIAHLGGPGQCILRYVRPALDSRFSPSTSSTHTQRRYTGSVSWLHSLPVRVMSLAGSCRLPFLLAIVKLRHLLCTVHTYQYITCRVLELPLNFQSCYVVFGKYNII